MFTFQEGYTGKSAIRKFYCMPCQTNFTSVFRFEEHRKSKEHAQKAGEEWKDPGAKVAETPAAATSDKGVAKESDGGDKGKGKALYPYKHN